MARNQGWAKARALIPENETPSTSRRRLRRVRGHCAVCRCSRFRPNPYQLVKPSRRGLVALASSVKELGVLQPIMVVQ